METSARAGGGEDAEVGHLAIVNCLFSEPFIQICRSMKIH
jgi:hypothetical protein